MNIANIYTGPLVLTNETPITTEHGTFPTRAEVARYYGIHIATVYKSMRDHGNVNALVAEVLPRKNSWQPVRSPAGTFANVAAAAKHHKVTPSTVYVLLYRNGHLNMLGKGRGAISPERLAVKYKPFTIGPYTWPTMSAASTELEIPLTTLHRWMRGPNRERYTQQLLARMMAYTRRLELEKEE